MGAPTLLEQREKGFGANNKKEDWIIGRRTISSCIYSIPLLPHRYIMYEPPTRAFPLFIIIIIKRKKVSRKTPRGGRQWKDQPGDRLHHFHHFRHFDFEFPHPHRFLLLILRVFSNGFAIHLDWYFLCSSPLLFPPYEVISHTGVLTSNDGG